MASEAELAIFLRLGENAQANELRSGSTSRFPYFIGGQNDGESDDSTSGNSE